MTESGDQMDQEKHVRYCDGSEDCDQPVKHRVVTVEVNESDPFSADLSVSEKELVVCDMHQQMVSRWASQSERRFWDTEEI